MRQIIGKMGIGKMRVGKMGTNRMHDHRAIYLFFVVK